LPISREDCEAFADDITRQLWATPSPLGDKIARSLDNYSVAFLVKENGVLLPAGSGTTVSFLGYHYFLTASHVWHKGLKRAAEIVIPLRENTKRNFRAKPSWFEPIGHPEPNVWSKWGPDMILLRVPPAAVSEFTAIGRSFHNLSNPIRRSIECAVEAWFQLGAPAEKGRFGVKHAVPEMHGMLVRPDTGHFVSTIGGDPNFDLIEIPIDSSQPGVASRLNGISGGGLWRVYVYKNADGEIEWFRILEGVAFYGESHPEPAWVLLRCHGPQSIGIAVRHLVQGN
jgi:hypothetical protein